MMNDDRPMTCHIREKASEKVYSELGRLRAMKDEAARNGRKVSIAVATLETARDVKRCAAPCIAPVGEISPPPL